MKSLLDKIIFPLSGINSDRYHKHYHRLIKSSKQTRTLILYSHGNGTTVDVIYSTLNKLAQDCNVDVLVYEYPGYGDVEGVTNASSINEEILFMYDEIAIKTYNYADVNIILMGRSIGTGPTLYLASTIDWCKAVILVSPFTSINNLVSLQVWGFGWLLTWFIDEMFNNEYHITNIDTNTGLLIIHGEKDQIIPITMGQKLFDISCCIEKKIYRSPNGTHNSNIWVTEIIKHHLF